MAQNKQISQSFEREKILQFLFQIFTIYLSLHIFLGTINFFSNFYFLTYFLAVLNLKIEFSQNFPRKCILKFLPQLHMIFDYANPLRYNLWDTFNLVGTSHRHCVEESQVISPVPNLFLWDPARFRPAVPQIKCQERGELVLISPVYDYGETGYIGNMQLPPQPTDITHISMGNSAITLCVHQWQIKGKERLLCVILCNNSCYAWNVWCMDLNWH